MCAVHMQSIIQSRIRTPGNYFRCLHATSPPRNPSPRRDAEIPRKNTTSSANVTKILRGAMSISPSQEYANAPDNPSETLERVELAAIREVIAAPRRKMVHG